MPILKHVLPNINEEISNANEVLMNGNSLLHQAIEFLIEKGADIEKTDQIEKYTAIFALINQEENENTFEIFDFLLSKGANLNAINIYNQTPVIFALSSQKNEFLKRFIQNNVKLSFENFCGIEKYLKLPFHICILSNFPKLTFDLIDRNQYSINDIDGNGDSALAVAFSQKRDPFNATYFDKLIELGADLNFINPKTGDSILHVISRSPNSLQYFNYLMTKMKFDLSKTKLNFKRETPYYLSLKNHSSYRRNDSLIFKSNYYYDKCPICDEVGKEGEGVQLFTLDNCGHAVCMKCFEEYIESSYKYTTHFNCPFNKECQAEISFFDIQKLATKEQVERIEKNMVDSLCSTWDDFKWCIQCDNGFIHNGGICFAKCDHCDVHFCTYCKENLQKFTEEEKEIHFHDCARRFTQKVISTTSKSCPKCGVNITHVGGCSHMTCYLCNYQFCWICCGPYIAGRYLNNFSDTSSCTCND